MANYRFCPIDLHAGNCNKKRSVVASDYATGKAFLIFPSIREAARELNIRHSNIVACLKRRTKTAGGYLWSYLDEEERSEGE